MTVPPTMVRYQKSQMQAVFGFVTLAFAFATVRAFTGAETSTGRIVGVGIMGVLTLGAAAVFVTSRRHPSWLAVGDETIESGFEGLPRTVTIDRTRGDLVLRMGGAARARHWVLAQTGSENAISLQGFNQDEVRAACASRGWRFAS